MKKAVLAVAVMVGLAVAAVAIVPPLLFSDGVDYSHVSTIEKEATYRDEALMARALELPVAATYVKGGLEDQRNWRFCRPATAVGGGQSLCVSAHEADMLSDSEV